MYLFIFNRTRRIHIMDMLLPLCTITVINHHTSYVCVKPSLIIQALMSSRVCFYSIPTDPITLCLIVCITVRSSFSVRVALSTQTKFW